MKKELYRRLLAVVSGYGYGKTTFGVNWHFDRVLRNYNSPVSLVIGADYKLLRQVCLELYEQYLVKIGLSEGKHFKINKSAMTLTFRWGIGQKVVFLSAEKPSKIMSYTASHALFDEPARCSSKANENLQGRLRCPLAFIIQTLYTTTPEGLNWFYELFDPSKLTRSGKHSYDDNKLVLHGSSFDNPELPKQFFDAHKEMFGWDGDLFLNYIMGHWVNLSKDRFYFKFNETKHVKDVLLDADNKKLVMAWDNNVGTMTWAVGQIDFSDRIRFIDDNGGAGRNIDDCMNQFFELYKPSVYKDFAIDVYGDPTLHHRSNQTYTTGYEVIEKQLKKYFRSVTIKADEAYSEVEERNRHTNRLFANNRIVIGKRCKKVIESFRQVEFKNGKVKKGANDTVTHAAEAIDHTLIQLFEPLTRTDQHGVTW